MHMIACVQPFAVQRCVIHREPDPLDCDHLCLPGGSSYAPLPPAVNPRIFPEGDLTDRSRSKLKCKQFDLMHISDYHAAFPERSRAACFRNGLADVASEVDGLAVETLQDLLGPRLRDEVRLHADTIEESITQLEAEFQIFANNEAGAKRGLVSTVQDNLVTITKGLEASKLKIDSVGELMEDADTLNDDMIAIVDERMSLLNSDVSGDLIALRGQVDDLATILKSIDFQELKRDVDALTAAAEVQCTPSVPLEDARRFRRHHVAAPFVKQSVAPGIENERWRGKSEGAVVSRLWGAG